MHDASAAVDRYLAATYGVGLEQVLTDATTGRVPLPVANSVRVGLAERIDWYLDDEDGGVAELFQGVLSVEGVSYRWRCSVFTDRSGARFISHLVEFTPVAWSVQ